MMVFPYYIVDSSTTSTYLGKWSKFVNKGDGPLPNPKCPRLLAKARRGQSQRGLCRPHGGSSIYFTSKSSQGDWLQVWLLFI